MNRDKLPLTPTTRARDESKTCFTKLFQLKHQDEVRLRWEDESLDFSYCQQFKWSDLNNVSKVWYNVFLCPTQSFCKFIKCHLFWLQRQIVSKLSDFFFLYFTFWKWCWFLFSLRQVDTETDISKIHYLNVTSSTVIPTKF